MKNRTTRARPSKGAGRPTTPIGPAEILQVLESQREYASFMAGLALKLLLVVNTPEQVIEAFGLAMLWKNKAKELGTLIEGVRKHQQQTAAQPVVPK